MKLKQNNEEFVYDGPYGRDGESMTSAETVSFTPDGKLRYGN